MAVVIAETGATLFFSPGFSTLIAIAGGAVAGLFFCRTKQAELRERIELELSKATGVGAAVTLLLLLIPLTFFTHSFAHTELGVFSIFFRSGARVFGGGHVVLPLLENAVVAPGLVTQETFLAGYGAAQALPGPLFCFGAYLGASVRPALHPLLDGVLALVGIFTPGLLAMSAVLPFWKAWRGNRTIHAALKGINASVVGILIAALFQPLWTATVHTIGDFWIALLALALLTVWKIQPWMVVVRTAIVCSLVVHRQ